MEFLLEVWRIDNTCLFKLSWGKGHSLDARILFPSSLPKHYQDWAEAYHTYYSKGLHRGRVTVVGKVAATPINWETRLNFTQSQLINALRDWLRGRELFEIRRVLSEAAQGNSPINLLIQCQDDPKLPEENFSLAKLPWECLGKELGDRTPIHVLRTTHQRPFVVKRSRRSKLRILAIFGDDTGLSFTAERAAIEKKLRPIADVQFEGHNISPKMSGVNLKAQIKQAIEDPLGWDILFFAGHSDDGWGGEVMLAPGYSALIDEFEEALKIARDQGLQFALFNSCKGCAIAEKLIAYGLSHVVVMREKVVNEVAQVFFQEFADRLANLEDVQTAALGAVKDLASRAQEHYQYPSAYLVPSVYAYSGVQPLKPPPLNWRVMLARLRPSRREAIVLIALAIFSCQTGIQYTMIDRRQLTQAFLLDIVHLTIPEKSTLKPPILLVKVDDNSLNAKGVIDKDPLDRGYMASLVTQASRLKAPVIGIDYVFKDNNRPRQIELSQALAEAHKHSRVILGASRTWGTAYEKIIDPRIRVDGDIDVNVASNLKYEYPVFFARTIGDLQNPRMKAIPFPQQILYQWNAFKSKDHRLNPTNAYYHSITAMSAWIGQQWLNPWINYAISTDQAYEAISSQDFLELSDPISQVLLIVPSEEFDKFKMPAVLNYHIAQEEMAGGEIHAYQLYNLLTHSLITPIPDLWMIGLAGIIGKLLLHWLQNLPIDRSLSRRGWFVLTIILPMFAYGLSFWAYSIVSIIVPILFPTLTYFSYLIAHWWQEKSRESKKIRVL
jgi:hypothetical protein